MFVDLVGSTALSARLDPEDMREIIGAYHRCCADQITKAGGFVAKYIGDGVLAYFGYPQAHEDDAERAAQSGLALVGAVSRIKTGHEAVLQARIGIATGVVVVGDLIGEGAAQEQAVVGETPNRAARLQGLAEPGHVVISHSTRRLTGGLFEYHDLGRIALKGLSDPVQAWQVTSASMVQSRFEAQHGAILTPLVGREEELELLLRRWRQAASGEGRVVLLSGEPGIGKSRVTVALQERLQGEPHTRLRYFCSPHHTDSALYPTISQLERAAAFERHDTPDAKLEKLISLLNASSEHASDTQLIAQLLSIPTGDHYAPLELSPQRKKEKTFEALLGQLEVLARQRPVLMVYEDVHWSDPSSRELLDMTVERVARLPVLLLITFRPEFQPPWIGPAHVSPLSLSRLGRREGMALAGSVAGDRMLSDVVIQEIIDRTDGVPLFLEELTKAVTEAGAREGEIVSALLSATSVPATLHASLMARLDRLGPTTKEVAQMGAAIGREFSYEVLAAIARKSDAVLRNALNGLNEAGLVFCRGIPPQATYLFKHALVRDAAYGSMLRSQRRDLHASIVAALENLDTEPTLLGQHCADAGLQEKAVGYWLGAGQQALERSTNVEAVALLTKGLSLLETMPENAWRQREELELQIALGQAFQVTRGPGSQETGKAYARAMQLGERLDQRERLPPIIFGAWVHHLMSGEPERSRQDAMKMERLAEEEHDPRLKVMGCRVRGQSEFLLGNLAAARTYFERGLTDFNAADRQFYSAITVQDGRVLMLAFLCKALAALGYLDQSQARADDAVDEGRSLRHNYTLGLALVMSLTHGVISGRVAASMSQALRRSEELEMLADEHKMPSVMSGALAYRGRCLVQSGRTEDGLALIARGNELNRAMGWVSFAPFSLAQAADAYGMAGQAATGFSKLDEAEKVIQTTGERWYEAEVHRLRGKLLRATRDDANAEISFRRAIMISQGQSAKLFELRASTSLARLWRDQGKRSEARDLLAPIYGWFTEGFDTPVLKEAKALLEELS